MLMHRGSPCFIHSPARGHKLKPAVMQWAADYSRAHHCRCSRRPWEEVAEVNSGKSIQEQLSDDTQESVANLVDVDRTGELLLWIWSSIFGKHDKQQVTEKTSQLPMQTSEGTQLTSNAAEQPPSHALPPGTCTECIILGGDCFWCLDAAFRRVKGVVSVVCGYTGGSTKSPTYQQVASGSTGHAEVVCVEYNPSVVTLNQILAIWLVVIGHSSEDKQKAQYRPLIGCISTEQYAEARAVLDSSSLLSSELIYVQPTLTGNSVAGGAQTYRHAAGSDRVFWPAEQEHQDMFSNQPTSRYSLNVIRPKLALLETLFHTNMHAPDASSL